VTIAKLLCSAGAALLCKESMPRREKVALVKAVEALNLLRNESRVNPSKVPKRRQENCLNLSTSSVKRRRWR